MALNLDSFPKELIAAIAEYAGPTSVLQLSATCHRIRSACWHSSVFKNILAASQREYWNSKSLDLEAISTRARQDVTIWARYCIADERARQLVERGERHVYASYMPELAVVKHPVLQSARWREMYLEELQTTKSSICCVVVTALAGTKEPNPRWPQWEAGRRRIRSDGFTEAELSVWALCQMVVTVQEGFRSRLAVWPYNDAANVPHIEPPLLDQIPLRPLSAEYNLPAPFSRRSSELFGKATTSFSAWDSWYGLHNAKYLLSSNFLTQGSWCGYSVTLTDTLLNPLSPPMVDIKFELADDSIKFEHTDDWLSGHEGSPQSICARDCVDGVDSFHIDATVSSAASGVKIFARKRYLRRGIRLVWNLTLTPFGLIGAERPEAGRRQSLVWLWNSEWTAPKSA